jgi:hypothetical protein
LVVIFAEREDDTIRIISLRKASKYERKRFEEFLRETNWERIEQMTDVEIDTSDIPTLG